MTVTPTLGHKCFQVARRDSIWILYISWISASTDGWSTEHNSELIGDEDPVGGGGLHWEGEEDNEVTCVVGEDADEYDVGTTPEMSSSL